MMTGLPSVMRIMGFGFRAPRPANLDCEQAAAIPTLACIALQALRGKGEIESGQTVLVVGASEGVGMFAVQLAKSFGAYVTGVCSTAKVDPVRAIGADRIIELHPGGHHPHRAWELFMGVWLIARGFSVAPVHTEPIASSTPPW